MQHRSYKSTLQSVELLDNHGSPRSHYDDDTNLHDTAHSHDAEEPEEKHVQAPHEENGASIRTQSPAKTSKSRPHTNSAPPSNPRRTSTFRSEQERQSFHAIISLREIEPPAISSTEHKACGIMAIVFSIFLICILSYGQLSEWQHSSYMIDPADNTSKIYNTSFTVQCSWRRRHYTQHIPFDENYYSEFVDLCKHKEHTACLFRHTGQAWFAMLLWTVIGLVLVSVVLLKPTFLAELQCRKRRLCKYMTLQYVGYVMAVCGALCMLSIIPITSVMREQNDICGNQNYSEHEDGYQGVVYNQDQALWTLYVIPVVGVCLLLSACFLQQMKPQPDLTKMLTEQVET